MKDAPKEIWAETLNDWVGPGGYWDTSPNAYSDPPDVKYIRADIAADRIEELEVENARLREYYEAAMADNARLREYYEARESLDRCILFQESGLIACQKRFASAWSVMQETDK